MSLCRQLPLCLLLLASTGCAMVERHFGPIPFPIPPLKSDPGPNRSPQYAGRFSALPTPWIGSCQSLYECTLTYATGKTVLRDTFSVRLKTSNVDYPKPYVLTVQLLRRNTNFEGNQRSYADWDVGTDSLTVEYRGKTINATDFKDCEQKPRTKRISAAVCWLFSFSIPDEYPSE